MFDDNILATVTSGTQTAITLATMTPGIYYNKAADYYNNQEYEAYTYYGTNIGNSSVATDWTAAHVLTVSPGGASNYDTTSKLELHKMFYSNELLDAINQAINFYAHKGFIDLKDETTISLTRTERNDVSDSYIYTYEYTMPTTFWYLHRITTEDNVAGVKITGTLSDDLTLGEVATGDSSGATGLVSYTSATDGYIRIREESGTFTTDDTITGVSTETVTSISEIDRTEVSGDGKFPEENLVDPRDWRIINRSSSTPTLKLDENQYIVVEDLRLRLEGQGIQDECDLDTDTIFINPAEFCEVAATFLPFSKIESTNLTAKFNQCLKTRERIEVRPPRHPYANSRRVVV